VAPDLQNRWNRFWAVCIFRCAGASPEIPDFPETPEKSLEYLSLTDKIVLSGDFQDSPIHPPPLGDIKMLSAVRHMQNTRQSYLFAVRFIKSARQSIFQQFSKIYKNIKFIKLVQTKLCCLLLIETRLEVKLNLNVVSPTNLTISLL
jgi:hypothetical protein